MVSLIYLSSFWRSLKIPLINCEIKLIRTGSKNCFITNATSNPDKRFTITDTELYVRVVTLSTNDNGKLFQQLKSGLKLTVNRRKYHSNTTKQND